MYQYLVIPLILGSICFIKKFNEFLKEQENSINFYTYDTEYGDFDYKKEYLLS